MIHRLTPRVPEAARVALAEQADAILDAGSALVALDRRDVEAAYERGGRRRMAATGDQGMDLVPNGR